METQQQPQSPPPAPEAPAAAPPAAEQLANARVGQGTALPK